MSGLSRFILAATALTAAAVLPVTANALDEKQKQEIGAFIKEYLIANPEIMLEVQDALEQKQQEARLKQASAAIAENKDALFSSSHDIALGNPKATSRSLSSSTTIAATASAP